MKYLVRAPATTANLGPGFDCLGLALDLWNEVEVETTTDGLEISVDGEGKGEVTRDPSNAIHSAMQAYAQCKHMTLPRGMRLRCNNRIPFGAGLGSSAAAAISGILAASAVLGIARDVNDELFCATLIEGHPDNVAPSLLGGLVAAVVEDHTVISRSLKVADLALVIVVPDFHFPTRSSRASLPPELPRKDAVFNLGRLALLTDALAGGDLDLLAFAMQDQLHQPYRIPVIPGAAQAIAAAKSAGAAAVALSGAGPSLMAVLRDEKDGQRVGQAMVEAFKHASLTARVFTPRIAQVGAEVKVLG